MCEALAVADDLVRRAVLERLAATPFGSLGRRAVVDDVALVIAADGVPAHVAADRVRREGAAMVAERLLGPAGEGMWRLTDAGRRAAAGEVEEVPAEQQPPLAEESEPEPQAVTALPVPPAPPISRTNALSPVAPGRRPVLPATPAEAQRWSHRPGTRMSRDERKNGYGGAVYGGIQPSRQTPNVFVYSDPGAGEKNGYDFDGWSPDGSLFTYTGEGKTGGQEMTKGNKAILQHRRDGRALRVFVADGYVAGSSARDHVYLGEFEVDEDDPYRVERAPDQRGDLRDVFVFRLLPVGEVLHRPQDGQRTSLVTDRHSSRGTGVGVLIDLSDPPPALTSPPAAWEEDDDERLRREVAAWLTLRSHDGADPVPAEELRGVVVDGRRVPLLRTGVSVAVADGGDTALTLVTPFSAGGGARPFDDVPGPDGLLRVPYRGASREHPENRALRRAMERGVQLVWLFGVGPASYLPVFPVFVVAEEPEERRFVVDPGVGQGFVIPGSPAEEQVRRYVISQTRRRLHQPVFRATVMRAYGSRCAVCALRHERLLDAAHIVPDADPRGIASVRNGLAMCKIHHAAFDADILGIRPEADGVGVVEIRADLLEERDGPMLLHGLQGHHQQPLRVMPADAAERPARELLEQRYEEFRSAG